MLLLFVKMAMQTFGMERIFSDFQDYKYNLKADLCCSGMSGRKLKWAQDPRNTSWTNNTTAFGHKMLMKMGWEKGRGLGANEDGNCEPIKLNRNRNNKGLGCTGYDNTWVAHQDNFSALLSELNKHSSKGDDSVEAKVVCLEESSKSQKRLHYKKFTKGKDLSKCNAADLNCIFGLKTHSLPSTPLNGSDNSDSDDSIIHSSDDINVRKCRHKKNKTDTDDKMELDRNAGNLIMADCNVNDYFKLKLEKFKQQSKQKLDAATKTSSQTATTTEIYSEFTTSKYDQTKISNDEAKRACTEKVPCLNSTASCVEVSISSEKKNGVKRKRKEKLLNKTKKKKSCVD